jgi:hypothetical protein
LSPDVLVVGARQHHLVTRRQLRSSGLSDRQVATALEAGLLARVESEVFLLASGRRDALTRLHAACLGTGGIASHRSAAALWEVGSCRLATPEVSVPRERFVRRSSIRVHASTDLHLVRAVVRDGIPVTPLERTLLDLGAVAPRQLEAATIDAVSRRLTTWPALLTALVAHSRRGRRGCGPLRRVLDEHFGDTSESLLEHRFLRLLRAAGLPEPEAQVDVFDDDGFVMRLDYAYPGLLIGMEVDSVLHHSTAEAFERDRVKRNRLRILGWLLLEVTSRRMRQSPARVCEEVAAARRVRCPAPT